MECYTILIDVPYSLKDIQVVHARIERENNILPFLQTFGADMTTHIPLWGGKDDITH